MYTLPQQQVVELYKYFVECNAEEGGVYVPFTDVEFYAEQVQIDCDNMDIPCTSKAAMHTAEMFATHGDALLTM